MEPRSSTRPGHPRSGEAAGTRAEDGSITVLFATPGWHAAVPRAGALARRAVAAALQEAGAHGAVTILLADDAIVKRLNGRHRAKAKATNVLSFPADVPGYLGDVAVALGVVRREARGARRRTADHLAHLVAHGALHLAGHDHLQAGEARRMERAEARIMRRLGRPNPWKEGRATARTRGAP
jgi:probable rRNA maturation factor